MTTKLRTGHAKEIYQFEGENYHCEFDFELEDEDSPIIVTEWWKCKIDDEEDVMKNKELLERLEKFIMFERELSDWYNEE